MDVVPGHRVTVPFGRRISYGFVVSLGTEEPDVDTKPISTAGSEPLLLPHQVALARLVADHYWLPLIECIRAMLPPRVRGTGTTGAGASTRQRRHSESAPIHECLRQRQPRLASGNERMKSSFAAKSHGKRLRQSLDEPGGLHVLETECIPEIVDPQTGRAVSAGDEGELVITNLGRVGSPLIRYRTGDLVRVAEPLAASRLLDCEAASGSASWRRLDGGILGRCDDMIHVRGNNLYPAAIEAIIRRFSDVAEYRIHVDHSGPLADLRIEVEPADGCDGPQVAEAVSRAVRDDLLFRVEVTAVPPGTLPRFELKARRLVHRR